MLSRLITALLVAPALAAVQAATAPTAGAGELCPGEHLYPVGRTTSFTYTAPAGYLVSSWCVKAGTEAEIHDANDGHGHALPAPSVTISHSSGKEVSHYSVVLVRRTYQPLAITNVAQGSYDVDHGWRVTKSVDRTRADVPQGGTAPFRYTVRLEALPATRSGHRLGGTATVTNPNSSAMVATLSTTVTGGGACAISATDASPAAGHQVAVSPGSNAFAYTCPPGASPADGSTTAGVSWDAATYPQAGAGATYTRSAVAALAYTVDQRTDELTTVTDTFDGGVAEGLGTFDWDDVWAANAQHTVVVTTYTRNLAGAEGRCTQYPNVAKESADGTTDAEGVTVCVRREGALDVTAAATADLVRSYAWSLTKVADATERTTGAGNAATFRYTVQVTAGAATESGWQLRGTTTVSNPNEHDDDDITAELTATTDLGGGAACTVTGGQDVVIGNGDEVTLPVVCTFASEPAGSGGLTVTATWDPAGPATSAADSTATPVTFGVRSETDKVVDVVDDKTAPGQRVVLAEDLLWEPGLSRTYTYSLALPGGPASGTCATYTNVARVDLTTGTDPTASATVEACAPPPEVAGEEAGKAVGSVTATCQGTVRSTMANRTAERVVYTLRVGRKAHEVAVASGASRKFTTRGAARARVVLKAQGRVLGQVRVPERCAPPDVLPETGLRGATAARLASLAHRWR